MVTMNPSPALKVKSIGGFPYNNFWEKNIFLQIFLTDDIKRLLKIEHFQADIIYLPEFKNGKN